MICYHHNDLDGKAAAYVLHKYHYDFIQDDPDSYVQCTYESKFNRHTQKDDVFIVDLSISPKTYNNLLEICKTARTVTWIDHHKSSVDIINEHFDELQGISNLTYFVSECACGAALTYAFLHIPLNDINSIRDIDYDQSERYYIEAKYDKGSIDINTMNKYTDDKMNYTWRNYRVTLPTWLYFIDDHDCWKNIDKNTEYFILGCDSCNNAFTVRSKCGIGRVFNTFWDSIENASTVHNLLNSGKNIHKYIHSRYYRELRNTFEWKYNNCVFICKNGTGNSWNFEDYIKKYPAVILFYYSGRDKKWIYSVYSDEKSTFNCKEFCEKFGGGGHLHAAGFSTDTLIFTDSNIREKSNKIFLGGTCNGDPWREEFIDLWKKLSKTSGYENIKSIDLFNPVVENWTKECEKKENEIKSNAFINLFVITPKMKGFYSIAEAVECSHNGKVAFIIYDKNNEYDNSVIKSFDAIGNIITSNGGAYSKINDMAELVKFVADLV